VNSIWLTILDAVLTTPLIYVLVGTDYYWTLVTGEFVRANEGLIAVERNLG